MKYPTGIHSQVTSEDYHSDPALGSTSLKTLATRTPAHWKWEQEHPVQKDAYDIGTLAHSLILEGDDSKHEVIDVPDKRGNKWTIPADKARNEGRIPLLPKEWADIVGMRDSVMAHPDAKRLFTGHRAEESVFWEEDGLPLKCRPDAWLPNTLTDLKTGRSADPNEFGKVAAELGYHQSAAHYKDGVRTLTGEDLPFRFVLVEKTAPYFVSVVELDWEAIDLGRGLNERAKRIYRECSEADHWPGYPTTFDVALPNWAVYKTEDLLGINELELKL